jgi:hypothetical protein
MPEQHLDHADVDLLIQQVGGKAVATGCASTPACRSRPLPRRHAPPAQSSRAPPTLRGAARAPAPTALTALFVIDQRR